MGTQASEIQWLKNFIVRYSQLHILKLPVQKPNQLILEFVDKVSGKIQIQTDVSFPY